jgi:hypothetical protein
MTIANIVLTDGQATPVDHTFVPIADGASSVYVNTTGASTVQGQETLRIDINRAKTDTADNTARVVLVGPQEATVDGVVIKVGEVSLAINLRATPGTTAAMVNDVLAMAADLLAESAFRTSVKNFLPQI